MNNNYKKTIFLSLLWCFSLHGMRDKKREVNIHVSCGGINTQNSQNNEPNSQKDQDAVLVMFHSDSADNDADSTDSSVDSKEWCMLDSKQQPAEQEDVPSLFCLEGQDGWSLVGGKQVAFGLIDSVMTQMVEIQQTAQDAQKAFNEQKDIICVLMRRTSPDYCYEVKESLKNNFRGTGIDYKAVYGAIGLSFEEAKEMAHTQISAHLAGLRDAGAITLRQYRQLGYPFKTAQSKEEYDAFCTNTLEQLMCGQEKQQELVQEFQKIIQSGPVLADIHRVLMQLEELKVPVDDE